MLRDVIPTDLERFFEFQNEPEGARMAAMRPRDREAFFAHWRDRVLPNPEGVVKTIVDGDEVVGNVMAFAVGERRFVGYWIGMAYAGRGFATAALAEMLARYETARPVYATVAVSNPASVRVLEKCGFRAEGDIEVEGDGIEVRTMRLDVAARHP